MPELLPEFDQPPVIETALSIQFSRLAGFSTAHSGWYWREYLTKVSTPGTGWADAKIAEAPRLEDVFERFEPNEMWGHMGFLLGPGGESQRIQIISVDDERMVQVQDSRIVLNWRKRSGQYPRFSVLSPGFWIAFRAFQEFTSAAKLGSVEPNQWEVTYVNHIPRGDMWESPRDWPRILPNVSFPEVSGSNPSAETLSGDWRFALAGQKGRLYVALRHARVAPHDSQVLMLTLTARGPINPAAGMSAEDGFNLAHEAIVRSFTSMTSSEAHKRWKRKR